MDHPWPYPQEKKEATWEEEEWISYDFWLTFDHKVVSVASDVSV